MVEEKCLLDNLADVKYFDLYQNLKSNLKEYQHNCKDKIDNIRTFGYYCLNCKLSFCNDCDSLAHKEHSCIRKSMYEMEPDVVENIYAKIKIELDANRIIQLPKELKDQMIANLTEQVDVIHTKLEDFKEKNIQEINRLFDSIYSIGDVLSTNINQTKIEIDNFFLRHKNFFNCDKYNNDLENTVFLLSFDLLNNCYKKNKEVTLFMSKLESNIYTLEDNITAKIEEISRILEQLNEENEIYSNQYTTKEILKGVATLNQDHYTDIKTRLNKYDEHIDTFKGLAFDNISKTGNVRDIEKIIHVYDKKNINKTNLAMEDIEEEKTSRNYSSQKDVREFNDIGDEHYAVNESKVNKIENNDKKITENNKNQSNINSTNRNISPNKVNKRTAYSSKNTYGSASSSKNTYGSASSAKQTNGTSSRKKEAKYVIKTETSRYETENLIQTDFNIAVNFKSKHDVILDNRILHRYFAYNTLDFINKEYRVKERSITSGTSFAYLPTIVTEIEDEEHDNDVCKPIIGTNEIQIYDRKKRILIKKKIKLEKHIHGYTNFLDGVRYLLMNDKLYITGGKDEIQDYKVVLCYDTRDLTLKRLGDMITPRSHHTMQYNELFKTILVIGGQNNASCEILDMKMNRWRNLPPLNYPRANVSVYFDDTENNLYAFFGIEGDISRKCGDFSYMVEVLKFKNVKLGWVKVDYNNKSDLIFKKVYLQIFPITNDKILIYGAKNLRNTGKKHFSILILSKNEIVKIEGKTLEDLRVRARKSPRLSKILCII